MKTLTTDDWVALTAIGTCAAALIALLLGVYAALRDGRDRRDAQRERRASQARAVTLWVDNTHEGAVIHVHNGSDLPITRLFVPVIGPPYQDLADGSHEFADVEVTELVGTLYGRGTCERLYGARSLLREPFAIEFADAHGVRWKRLSDGTLVEQR